MELFLMGMAVGIASAVCLFVIINLEIPARLDEVEGEVRDHTAGYQAAKTTLWLKIKRKFSKEQK